MITRTNVFRASVVLLAPFIWTGCAESAPDDVTPANVQTADQQQNAEDETGNTAATTPTDRQEKAVTKHKPEVERTRGSLDDGTRVDLRPKEEPPATVEPAPEPEKEDNKPLDGELGGGTVIDLEAPVEAPSRGRKRMNIDQLDATLRRVTGGIGWTSGKGWTGNAAGKNNFATLALTLGKPNYTDLTAEDLDPSALFQKFLGDAASSVCLKLIDRDIAEKSATKRILLRHVSQTDTSASNPGGVDKNLSELLLRFHGVKVAPNAAQLQQWRFLFTTATKVSKSPTMGWRAVCVALIQHPRFYTY